MQELADYNDWNIPIKKMHEMASPVLEECFIDYLLLCCGRYKVGATYIFHLASSDESRWPAGIGAYILGMLCGPGIPECTLDMPVKGMIKDRVLKILDSYIDSYLVIGKIFNKGLVWMTDADASDIKAMAYYIIDHHIKDKEDTR